MLPEQNNVKMQEMVQACILKKKFNADPELWCDMQAEQAKNDPQMLLKKIVRSASAVVVWHASPKQKMIHKCF